MEIAEMILTALLSFAALFFLTKLIGCRQVSQLSLFDYINGITIGSLAADLAIAGPGQRLAPLIGMMIYAGATFILSLLTDKSIAARRVIEGRPLVLLEHDSLKEENFARARIDLGEFLMRARVAGYFDLSQLSAAVLEPKGVRACGYTVLAGLLMDTVQGSLFGFYGLMMLIFGALIVWLMENVLRKNIPIQNYKIKEDITRNDEIAFINDKKCFQSK